MYKKLLLCIVYSSCIMAMNSKNKETERTSLVKLSDDKIKGDKEKPLFESPAEKTSLFQSVARFFGGEKDK